MNKAAYEILEHGKIPPQAVDLEEVILGALIIEGSAFDEIAELLTPECFYKDSHKELFKILFSMYDRNQQIDLLTVTEEAKKKSKLDEIGGVKYITQLTSRVMSAAHLKHHAAIIRDKAVARMIIQSNNDVLTQAYDNSVDVADLAEMASKQIDSIMEFLYRVNGAKDFNSIIKEALEEAETRTKNYQAGIQPGIPTPLTELTKMTGGWQNGDLIIIAGRPSMGKTAVALEIVRKASEEEVPVNIYSLEMQSVRLVDRMICGASGVNPEKYRNGALSTEEWEQLDRGVNDLLDLGIYIDDSPVVTMEYIKAKSRINKKKGNCGLIVIDYLGLLESVKVPGRSREQEVAEISRKAKLLAKELDVPVIMLSQLNRSCEGRPFKRPELADLRESGAIEQDADIVAFIYRAEKYGYQTVEYGNMEVDSKGVGELIVSKHRNGRIGSIFFKYNDSVTRMYDYINENELPDYDKQLNAENDPFPEVTNPGEGIDGNLDF